MFPHLLEDPDWLVAEDPGGWRLRIAVEEGPSVGAADPAGLDLEDRAFGIELRFRRLANLDRIDACHECSPHRTAPAPSSLCSAASALSAFQRSLITRDSALVMASGDLCMKMFRPTEHPIAPAAIAYSMR